jgi:hypothetical protein
LAVSIEAPGHDSRWYRRGSDLGCRCRNKEEKCNCQGRERGRYPQTPSAADLVLICDQTAHLYEYPRGSGAAHGSRKLDLQIGYSTCCESIPR